ncbi:hypothetical protein D9757_015141 [Collybiopsis confluens]|uniref:Transmembrane protein n=1 Tax=Collybiopsis confluens TaxID=2823264 RepID=A0A8H5C686_9AGAR|nr:hypothetical protein D9757_015141 [Collybiopsis confluens]
MRGGGISECPMEQELAMFPRRIEYDTMKGSTTSSSSTSAAKSTSYHPLLHLLLVILIAIIPFFFTHIKTFVILFVIGRTGTKYVLYSEILLVTSAMRKTRDGLPQQIS